ncbi:MAG TPA: Uma2 family endonuclease [Vicinamibacteria bacterium]|nr:Uma2 family endonuclease [Vicinamibacteria bacterium]
MASPKTIVKFTYSDLLALPEDGRRHEIIEGEHLVSPSPKTDHQRVSMRLSVAIAAHVRAHRLGEVFAAPLDVVLAEDVVVEPDLLFVSTDRSARATERNIQGAPDLVVEILSEWNRRIDEITKRDLYARHGVLEYWIVDPELETVKVYRASEQRFQRVAELAKENGDSLTTPLLPGLNLPLGEIFPAS